MCVCVSVCLSMPLALSLALRGSVQLAVDSSKVLFQPTPVV
jgi:hypothetical protein